jgi:hypothetical protein
MIAPPPTALTLPLRTARPAPRVPVVPPQDVTPRFTADGSAALEQHLAQTCRKIAAGVRGLIPPGKLETVLLGGGYGRGEGGVLVTPEGEKPYNDLEFYVCVQGNRHLNERRFGHALHVLGEILTPQAGLDVEFKITSVRELERSAVSMFSYDLISGHRQLGGSPDLLHGCNHHRDAEQIPVAEATRLLMNRCSGLLFARERLEKSEFTAADADFVQRNMAKAELALGDALLVVHRLYHWSVRERHRHVERIARTEARTAWLDSVRQHHADGVDFKLYPERSVASREALQAKHAALTALAGQVWLWVEKHRLGRNFSSPREYVQSGLDKCRETSALRNVAINCRTLGLRPALEMRVTRHPRERILHALALLLWEPAALTTPALLQRLQHDLQTEAADFPGLMQAYRKIWAQVN